jgi:DNA-binding LytR/AlgR family response regulator
VKYTFLIVDDEPYARKLLEAHTAKIDQLELAGVFENAIQASTFLLENKVDLLFLDIQMPEMNGFQLLSTLKNPPSVVITTAFRDFAPEAFEFEVIDYLLKPISLDRVLKATHKFLECRSIQIKSLTSLMNGSFIVLKSDRKQLTVLVADIVYVESLDNYVKIHLTNRVIVTRESISKLEQKLKHYSFIRIHRSYLVNAKQVRTLTSEYVEVLGKELPFGRSFRKSAIQQFSQ